MTMSLPQSHVDDTFPILLNILNDIPDMDFDETLMWDSMSLFHTYMNHSNLYKGWALPDQLTFYSVSSLLKIASLYPHLRLDATAAIIEFTSRTISQLATASGEQLYS